MEWKKGYLDVVLVPMGLLCSIVYHSWLWRKIRRQPHQTVIGINSAGRRLWVLAMIKDNEKKNILAVQTIRNSIMGSTLMATTSILLCTGLAAILSSTYSIKKPLNDTVYGAHGEVMMAVKYVTLLVVFLFSFFCYSLSIRFINQANFLINIPHVANAVDDDSGVAAAAAVTPDYVADILERAFLLNTFGNRLFYAALPLLPWIFGPVLVLVCSVSIVPILYHMDVVHGGAAKQSAGCCGKKEKVDSVSSMEEA